MTALTKFQLAKSDRCKGCGRLGAHYTRGGTERWHKQCLPSLIAPSSAGPEIRIETELRGKLAAKLIAEAKKRGRQPVELIAAVVELVIADDLFAAVLD